MLAGPPPVRRGLKLDPNGRPIPIEIAELGLPAACFFFFSTVNASCQDMRQLRLSYLYLGSGVSITESCTSTSDHFANVSIPQI